MTASVGRSSVHVTAIIVAWNAGADLDGCLTALRAQTHPMLDVVVVDNASEDGTAARLDAWVAEAPDWLTVVGNATNRGFAGGVNDGLAMTSAEAVLLVNADTRPLPDHVTALAARLVTDERIGSVQGRLLRTEPGRDGVVVVDSAGHLAFSTRLFRNRGEAETDRGQFNVPCEVFGVTGALALYRRAMLDDVAHRRDDGSAEVFDETLFAYFEDIDLDWRAQRRGWQAWYEPAAVATHERGGAGPRRTVVVERLAWRNRLMVVMKHDTWASLLPGIGFWLTLLLKTAELALTNPTALRGLLPTAEERAEMQAKGLAMRLRDVTPPDQVLARWFTSFNYAEWVTLWWKRVRGIPLGG